MELWPAIDLIDGKCVRLFKGDYAQKTQYEYALSDLAKDFSSFATGIHVVDLDGAKAGRPINKTSIQEIIANSSVPIEVGGGIRSLADIETVLSWGAKRVILGTKALEDNTFLANAVQQFGSDTIVVGVDAKDGMVATHGWETASSVSAIDFIKTVIQCGGKTVIFTDIATDGTLQGPAISAIEKITTAFPDLSCIASGGIGNMNDIQALSKTKATGCIFGKAWYENKISKQDLISFIKEKQLD